MKTKIVGALVGAICISTAQAQEEPKRYLSVAIGQARMNIEAGYAPLGQASASSGETADLSALDLSVIGSWPVGNRFAVHGRVGVYHGEMEPSGGPGFLPCINCAQPPTRGWREGGNEDLTYGFGATYAMTPASAFRLDWQRYEKLGGGGGPTINVDLVSLGLLIRF
jgi:hypothetical protein